MVTPMKLPWFLAIVVASILSVLSIPLVIGQSLRPQQAIRVDSIGKDVTLIGRLGEPLGTKIELQGKWGFPKTIEKDGAIRFTVHTVNQRKITPNVTFNIYQMRLLNSRRREDRPPEDTWAKLEGEEWTLIAYETGSIRITPDEYRAENRVFPQVAMPYYTEPFTSELVAVRRQD
jgi:hypothetical protein